MPCLCFSLDVLCNGRCPARMASRTVAGIVHVSNAIITHSTIDAPCNMQFVPLVSPLYTWHPHEGIAAARGSLAADETPIMGHRWLPDTEVPLPLPPRKKAISTEMGTSTYLQTPPAFSTYFSGPCVGFQGGHHPNVHVGHDATWKSHRIYIHLCFPNAQEMQSSLNVRLTVSQSWGPRPSRIYTSPGPLSCTFPQPQPPTKHDLTTHDSAMNKSLMPQKATTQRAAAGAMARPILSTLLTHTTYFGTLLRLIIV